MEENKRKTKYKAFDPDDFLEDSQYDDAQFERQFQKLRAKKVPRYIAWPMETIIRTIIAKGRPLISIDQSVISLYIKDNFDQPYVQLITRMCVDLNYNFIDVYNYLNSIVLTYNVQGTDLLYYPQKWKCDKVLPDWLQYVLDNYDPKEHDYADLVYMAKEVME